ALDEPTNHLDVRTVEWLEARLGQWPRALVVITHDRTFLDRVATRILEMDRGQLYAYEGDYTEFLVKQAERISVESEHERVRHAFVRREIEWIRKSPQARSVKQKARIDRFDIAVANRPAGDQVLPKELQLRLPSGPRLGSTIVTLENVAQSVGEGADKRTLFRNLTLTMKPGDRIGIVGKNGAGKTTLIRTILGELAPDEGKVIVGINTRTAYLEQGRKELVDTNTVIEEVSDGYDHVELPDGKVHVRNFLRTMGFPDSVVDSKVGQLSGGERNRVQLAKLLRRGGNLLVLDEPTNDLDLVTLGALEQALIDFPGCALIVSHDRWFLDRVATGILAFDEIAGKTTVTFYEGSYSSYLTKRPKAAAPISTGEKPRGEKQTNTPKSKIKLTFKEAAELAAMEQTIEVAEARVAEIEATLFDPDVVRTRGAEIPKLTVDLEAAREEVDRLYARWGALEAIPKA
ncbi:MAG: ATP-binding cassette domain-containing protein, partial [Proteobacteria bacterium]|nr:ATP-binding cassette domain-containing protein [Pseudomonadota bacterium]